MDVMTLEVVHGVDINGLDIITVLVKAIHGDLLVLGVVTNPVVRKNITFLMVGVFHLKSQKDKFEMLPDSQDKSL